LASAFLSIARIRGAWPPVKLRRISAMPFLVTGEKDKKFKLHFLTGFLIRQRSPLPGCPFLF
jgi:hypothetical protein